MVAKLSVVLLLFSVVGCGDDAGGAVDAANVTEDAVVTDSAVNDAGVDASPFDAGAGCLELTGQDPADMAVDVMQSNVPC